MISSLKTQKVLREMVLNYSVLENSRDELQEYVIKNSGFHLKKLS